MYNIPNRLLAIVFVLCVSSSVVAQNGTVKQLEEPHPIEVMGAVSLIGEPYKGTLLLSGNGTVPANATLSPIYFTVPAGKRFVIETISVFARARPEADVQGELRIRSTNGTTLGRCVTTLTPQGTWAGSVPGNTWKAYSSTTPCQIRLDSALHSIVYASFKTGADEAHFEVTLFGYFEDL